MFLSYEAQLAEIDREAAKRERADRLKARRAAYKAANTPEVQARNADTLARLLERG